MRLRSDRLWGFPYALNRTESTKLALEIVLVGIVAQAGDNQRLESIAANVGVIARVV